MIIDMIFCNIKSILRAYTNKKSYCTTNFMIFASVYYLVANRPPVSVATLTHVLLYLIDDRYI